MADSQGLRSGVKRNGVNRVAAAVFLLERFLPALLNAEDMLELAAEVRQYLVDFIPELALAAAGGDAEIHADIGDRAADGTTADLGLEFL